MSKAHLFIGLLLFLIGTSISYTSVEYSTINVTGKERVNSEDDSYYLIFTSDGVYKNEDSLIHMKFDSSDLYGKLKVGDTYKCKTNWFRVNFLSMYKNIISCE